MIQNLILNNFYLNFFLFNSLINELYIKIAKNKRTRFSFFTIISLYTKIPLQNYISYDSKFNNKHFLSDAFFSQHLRIRSKLNNLI